MTVIEAGQTAINKPSAEVFAFLADCNNHKQLMPAQVINWQSTEVTCSFTIQGTADLALRMKETIEDALIALEPDGRKPFDFMLKWVINPTANGCTVNAILEADLNMFLKMVAVKPLENFLKYQVEQLKAVLNG